MNQTHHMLFPIFYCFYHVWEFSKIFAEFLIKLADFQQNIAGDFAK